MKLCFLQYFSRRSRCQLRETAEIARAAVTAEVVVVVEEEKFQFNPARVFVTVFHDGKSRFVSLFLLSNESVRRRKIENKDREKEKERR